MEKEPNILALQENFVSVLFCLLYHVKVEVYHFITNVSSMLMNFSS